MLNLNRSEVYRSIALGFLGGTIICGSLQWILPPKYMFVTYAVFVIVVGYFGRHLPTYKERFLAHFLAFAVASMMFFVYSVIKTNAIGRVPVYFMALSLMAVLAIGAVINLAVAAVASPAKAQQESIAG